MKEFKLLKIELNDYFSNAEMFEKNIMLILEKIILKFAKRWINNELFRFNENYKEGKFI